MRLAKYLVMAAVGLCLSNPIADAKNINVGWKLIGYHVNDADYLSYGSYAKISNGSTIKILVRGGNQGLKERSLELWAYIPGQRADLHQMLAEFHDLKDKQVIEYTLKSPARVAIVCGTLIGGSNRKAYKEVDLGDNVTQLAYAGGHVAYDVKVSDSF